MTNRNAFMWCFLALSVAGIGGCSSKPSGTESKKITVVPDTIQGKVQINLSEASPTDAAMNAGGPSVYLWDGGRRYRLFLRTPVQVEAGKEYIAEGLYAQKIIDEIGDPDQGKNGYPLQSSCARVVGKAWPGLAFDLTDANVTALRTRVKRYPARPVFLVTKLVPAPAGSAKAKGVEAEDEDVPQITVAAEKQRALLVEGPVVQIAPLWAPEGGTARCKVRIDPDGKIGELETGAQLCETVQWSQFKFQPTVQRGHPVKVETEVEIRFKPRK